MLRKLVKFLIRGRLFRTLEPLGHLVEAVVAQIIFSFPARNLKIIGVTGTDGKTTTTSMIWRMLVDSGVNAGYMTTIGYGVPKWQRANQVHMTTMQVWPLLRRIRELKREGIEWLVLETTSHALAQNRVWAIPYSVAVMTNVGHEHLDYHGSFENYREAKRKLFQRANANRNGLRIGIANADDPSGELFANSTAHPMLYGVKAGQVRASGITSSSTGSRYSVDYDGKKLNIKVNVPGSFNVYNSLAAVCVGLAVGLKEKQIEQGIAALTTVAGRMTTVDEGQDFSVVVDFAHTPASYETLLSDMHSKVVSPHRLIVVIGSAGRRDEAKRAIQGRIAGKYADLVVVTEEDDRDVDGLKIMDQIAGGAMESGKQRDKDLFLVHDRTEAICFAFSKARKGDTVMLLGKGHETTIERADGEYPWNEEATAREALKKLAS
jgi:UDP-N-acetylmuramoyl-L-alanyl-D-glutamate--2,6-diaminopimelate ligase